MRGGVVRFDDVAPSLCDDAAMSIADGPRVALITGATGNLGRVAAAVFAADGYRLGLAGTDRGRLEALAHDLSLTDDDWVPAIGDLSGAGAAGETVAAVEARFGRVDVVLHLVGGWAGGATLVDLEPDTLETMLDQHLWSTFHVARAVVPGMTARGWGRIVAVTSAFTTAPAAKSTAYVAAKAAQEALLRVLAREVAGDGVTVNTIAVKKIDAARERETAPSSKNAGWATPDEIAATMHYLCSDAAAAVTGQRIALDGRG